jgi:hypothetical protein
MEHKVEDKVDLPCTSEHRARSCLCLTAYHAPTLRRTNRGRVHPQCHSSTFQRAAIENTILGIKENIRISYTLKVVDPMISSI